MRAFLILGLTALGLLAPAKALAGQQPTATAEPPRMQVAGSLGVASITGELPAETGTHFGPAADVRIGWRTGRRVVVGAQFGFYGMNDEKPRADDIVATGVNFGIITNRMPKIAQTRTMMGFVQWNRPSGLVIRTGAGFGGHAYAYYYPYPPDPFGAESIEWGLAFSFAAGKEWRRATRVGVSVEGFVTYSTGEDSTSPRVVTGVQVSPLLRIF